LKANKKLQQYFEGGPIIILI